MGSRDSDGSRRLAGGGAAVGSGGRQTRNVQPPPSLSPWPSALYPQTLALGPRLVTPWLGARAVRRTSSVRTRPWRRCNVAGLTGAARALSALLVDAIEALQRRIDRLTSQARTTPWDVEGRISLSVPSLGSAGRTRSGLFRRPTSALLAVPVAVGAQTGLLLVLAEGNYKDEASALAAAAVVAEFADELAGPLLSDADVVPAIRRAVLGAHEAICGLSRQSVQPGRFGTAGGVRRNLSGIGASIAACVLTPDWAWVTAVGECPTWLVRERRARRLSLPHTLANDPSYRATVRRDPDSAIDFAEAVVMKVLGTTSEAPSFEVTRVAVHPGDLIVLANEWLSPHVESLAERGADATSSWLCEAASEAIESAPGPMPVTVLVGGIDRERTRAGCPPSR